MQFHPTPPPTDSEVARVLTTIRARILRLLAHRDRNPDTDVPPDAVAEESPALAGFIAASVQGRVALSSRAGARGMALGPGWIRKLSGSLRVALATLILTASTFTPTSPCQARIASASSNSAAISCGRPWRRIGSCSPRTVASYSS